MSMLTDGLVSKKSNKLIYWFLINLFFSIFFLSFFNQPVLANLYLNEIYPAPLKGNYEWVEIFNDGGKEIDLTHYSLSDKTGKLLYFNGNVVHSNNYVIATSSSVLNNTGDTIFLKDDQDNLIEVATYSATLDSTQTVAKCPDKTGNWYVLSLTTKAESNYLACFVLSPTPTPTLVPSPTEIITPTLTLTPILTILPSPTVVPSPIPTKKEEYNHIFISEVMVNPDLNQSEWLELYNNNPYIVTLTDWFIDDIADGGSSPKKFSLTISAYGYNSLDLNSAIFNNNGDDVRLLNNEEQEKDKFQYSFSEKGIPWGRITIDNNNFCLQEESRDKKNNPCIDNEEKKGEDKGDQALVIGNSNTKTQIKGPLRSNKSLKNNRGENLVKVPQGEVKGLTTQRFNQTDDNYSRPLFNQLMINENLIKKWIIVKTLSRFSFIISLLSLSYLLVKIRYLKL